MRIYIASESGMPHGELREREDFIVDEGPFGRLFSYYHISSKKFTSGTCFRYLTEKGSHEIQRIEESPRIR